MTGGVLEVLLAAAAVAPLVDDTGTRIEAPWREVNLPQQTLPRTRHVPARIDGRAALWVEVAGSYGNLVQAFDPPQPVLRLRWSWRLEQANPRADLTRKAGDDGPVRVCASFAMPIDLVPLSSASCCAWHAHPAARTCLRPRSVMSGTTPCPWARSATTPTSAACVSSRS